MVDETENDGADNEDIGFNADDLVSLYIKLFKHTLNYLFDNRMICFKHFKTITCAFYMNK